MDMQIQTGSDLKNEIAKSYTPEPAVISVQMVADYKSILSDIMAGAYGNHSKPLWFRFRNVDGKCHMYYRMWATDPWRPDGEHELGLTCLKALPDLTRNPEWVVPSLERLDPDKLYRDLPDSYNDRMSRPVKDWWRQFLAETLHTDYEEIQPTRPSPLETLMDRTEQEDPMEDFGHLQGLQERIDMDCPDVYIGKQGKISKRKIYEVDNYSSVKEGMLVAVHCEEREGRPFIASVLERKEENVVVGWMKGSYTGVWHQWLVKSSRSMIPYTSSIPVSSLILWDFTLTSKGRLRSKTVEELRAKYEDLDS